MPRTKPRDLRQRATPRPTTSPSSRFTSGTTGKAKGTMHFHRDVLAICDCFPPYVLKPHARRHLLRLAAVRLHLRAGRLGPLPDARRRSRAAAGAGGAAAAPRGDPGLGRRSSSPRRRRTARCSACSTNYDISSLARCVSAGETLPRPTFEAWKEATGLGIIDGIGATEMLHIFISASGDDIRPGSTGRVVPGYEARVVDDDGARRPRSATIGRLGGARPDRLPLPRTIPSASAGTCSNGWNLTGDSYTQDADGYFWYQARTDDMIISSGYNISGAGSGERAARASRRAGVRRHRRARRGARPRS